MAHGSAYSTVKAALITQFKTRAALANVHVDYQAPVTPEDVRGENGAFEMIFCDDAEGNYEDVVICGNGLRFDETYTQTVVIQVLRPSSLGTQQAADQRAEELLYEVLAEISDQASWDKTALGLSQFDFVWFTPTSQRWEPGVLEGTTAGHGAKCLLGLEVNARRSFP